MNRKLFTFIKVSLCTLMLCATTLPVVAQEYEEEYDEQNEEQYEEENDTRNASFRLVYIAQGSQEEMPVEVLKRNLESAWSGVTTGPVIFYLSRGNEEPVIIHANCHANSDFEEERRQFDEELLDRLQNTIQYSGFGAYDKQRILELLAKNEETGEGMDIVDKEGHPLYGETFIEFHVGQDFWASGNHETVLASLFFELDIKKHINNGGNFHFNVFCPRKLTIGNNDSLFGLLNPDDCARYINVERVY